MNPIIVQVYNLPVVLRRDGAEFKLGQVVGVAGSRLVHLVRELLLHGDRDTITAVLHPLEVSTVQYSTVQYSTVQYSTVQRCAPCPPAALGTDRGQACTFSG